MYDKAKAADTEIAREFTRKLGEKIGDNLKKAVLFGSRAKGISKADSDYDLLLVLKKHGKTECWLNRLKDDRENDDYDIFTGFEEDDAKEGIKNALKFLNEMKRFLSKNYNIC